MTFWEEYSREQEFQRQQNEAYDKGILEGKKEALNEMVKNMKSEKFEVSLIEKYTGLSKEEIDKI